MITKEQTAGKTKREVRECASRCDCSQKSRWQDGANKCKQVGLCIKSGLKGCAIMQVRAQVGSKYSQRQEKVVHGAMWRCQMRNRMKVR